MRTHAALALPLLVASLHACASSPGTSGDAALDAASDAASDVALDATATDSAGTRDGNTPRDVPVARDSSPDAPPPRDVAPLPDSGADVTPPATGCAPLPAPTGMVINVTPAQADDLPSIAMNAPAGATIVLADGTYRMTGSGEAARRINLATAGVTLRSASNDARTVIIDAEYQTDEIIDVLASNVTIAHVTLTHAVNHAVHLTSYNPGDLSGAVLYGLNLVDNGEQFIKVNPDADHTAYYDHGRVECSSFELTDAGRDHVASNSGGGCYTGGIDNHGGRGWVVRQNTFTGIYCTNGALAEHAVHFWHGSRDTVIEDNVITDCARGVGLGLGDTDDPNNRARVYADNPYPGAGYIADYDARVRNNLIACDIPWYDTGISLEQARGARVFQNTVIDGPNASAFFSSIDYRFADTLVTIENNLTHRITVRDGAQGTVDHNVENTPGGEFVSASTGDYHLAAGATDAIDKGVDLGAEGGVDLEGHTHLAGAGPDLGAYESH